MKRSDGNRIDTRCGYVAITGRPNVGKSTLLNRILGQKMSITSRKPQTTRHQLLGIKTRGTTQALYVDTPGLHRKMPREINKYMNRSAMRAVHDVDLILFVVDRTQWTDDDEWVLQQLHKASVPIILIINKIDLLQDKSRLLPYIDNMNTFGFLEIMPISSLDGHNVEHLEEMIEANLPIDRHYFAEDQLTNRPVRFLVAEIVREKLMRQLGDEIPYDATVQIEEFRQDGTITHVSAAILVERDGQKGIVIGKSGSRLKQIGSDARASIELLIGNPVMLNLWVKVRSGWSDDERTMKSLGYDDV